MIRSRIWPLLIVLLCAVAVVPLLRADSPCSHDGAFHYYRVAALRHALQDGVIFTRYLPDLAFGYGYPFFNYREALSYYLALALHLSGLALPAALNLVYVLSIVGSALAAYLLARDLFGARAGLVAAVAYAYAPYQFLNALLRANAPESVALPLMPLILWSFRRLALTGRRRWFLASVGALSALYLTHNISSLLFTPLLAVYMLTLWLVYRRETHWIAVAGALALALGLTAFFLGPALLEQDYAQLHMSRVTRNNDFHYNFLPWSEILAPPEPVDTSLMNPPMRVHLGLVQAILGGVGIAVGFIRWRNYDKERRATLVFFTLTAIVMLWTSTHSSLWLWEHVPLLPFVQFPWRMVGRAILPISLLASIPFADPSSSPATAHKLSHLQAWLLPLASCILILSAFPYTYPPQGYCSSVSYPTIRDVFAYEHRSRLVGVDPEGSYFPVWVQQRPAGSPLEEQYAAGGPIERFDETVLPLGAAVVEADYAPNQARIVVETPTPFRARYLAFYFPGWRVAVDGEPVPIAPTAPEGLITFDVPAGNHTIAIDFGSTPIRTTFTAISIACFVALVILTIRYPRVSDWQPKVAPSQRSLFIVHCSLAIVLLLLKLVVVDRTTTPFRRPALRPDGALSGVEHTLNQPYADGMTLIGYDQADTTIPADGALRLDLYWTAYAQPSARYQTVVHLVGADGMRWSQPDSFRPRGYAKHPPTDTWRPGRYALDSHEVEPLPGTPPGTYDIVMTTFDRDTLAHLSALNEQGQPAAPELTLGQVTLTRPRRLVETPENNRLDISHMQLILLTANFDRDRAASGDSVHLTLMWKAADDYKYSTPYCTWFLVLYAPDNAAVASYWLPLPNYSWRASDIWRSQHQLALPAVLETGVYTWSVEWCSIGSDPIGQISIVAPPHTYTALPVAIRAGATLSNVATLTGATLHPASSILHPASSIPITLVWRAESTPANSYHVFLHLLDSTGKLVAQSDGIPADWSRPTTGWLPGEYIADVRTLTIPPDAPAGDYTLYAGLYDPNGARLTTPDGSDAILLTTIPVEVKE